MNDTLYSASSSVWVLTLKYLSVKVSFFVATTRSQSRMLFFRRNFFVRYFRYLGVGLKEERKKAVKVQLCCNT